MRPLFIFLFLISLLSFLLLLICSNLESVPFCSFLTEYYVYLGAASIHVGLFSVAMAYLWKEDLSSTLDAMEFPGDIPRNIILSIAGFAMVFIVLFFLGMAAYMAGFADQQAVYDKVNDLPLFILVFAIVAAPVSEELFFRAMLVPRAGVILSSVLFGLMHVAYGSIVEIAGAALIGLVLAIIYKASRSITPCLIIHILYNLISIIAMRFLI